MSVEVEADVAALEAVHEIDEHSLILPTHFFEAATKDVGLGLIANEDLSREGTELAFCKIPFWIAGGIGNFSVGNVQIWFFAKLVEFLRSHRFDAFAIVTVDVEQGYGVAVEFVFFDDM